MWGDDDDDDEEKGWNVLMLYSRQGFDECQLWEFEEYKVGKQKRRRLQINTREQCITNQVL